MRVAERKHNPFIGSASGGRVLSALMLPFFLIRPPAGFGVLTTTGRRTGKKRRKCIHVIRRGDEAYVVMLGPALLGRPGVVSAWLWNIRADPRVHLRIRGGTFAGVARELTDAVQIAQAMPVYCDPVNPFDYIECIMHRPGRPTRAKIQELHRSWFENGLPLVVELERSGRQDRRSRGDDRSHA
jgi:deazaflavin-dependent oxidoreductase (nitroreductase family)